MLEYFTFADNLIKLKNYKIILPLNYDNLVLLVNSI